MIYIVDDDEEILDLVGDIVTIAGLEAKLFSSPLELLQRLSNEKEVHLFLVDYQMPDLTGFELIEEIRKIPGFYHTPVLIFSANTSEDNIIEGLNLGADDYINKPFRNKILLARINRALLRNQEEKKTNLSYGFPPKEIFLDTVEQTIFSKFYFSISILGIQNFSSWNKNLNEKNREKISILFRQELKKLSCDYSRNISTVRIKNGAYAIFLPFSGSPDNAALLSFENKLKSIRDYLEKELQSFYREIEIKQGYFYCKNETSEPSMIPICRPEILSLSFSPEFSGDTKDIWELLLSMTKNKIHDKIFESWKY